MTIDKYLEGQVCGRTYAAGQADGRQLAESGFPLEGGRVGALWCA